MSLPPVVPPPGGTNLKKGRGTERGLLFWLSLSFLALVLVVILVVGGLFATAVLLLPGPRAIAAKLSRHQDGGAPSASNVPQPKVTEDVGLSGSAANAAFDAVGPTASAGIDAKLDSQAQDEMVFRLLDEDPQDTRICDQLGRVPMAEKDLNQGDLPYELVLGANRENAVYESFRYPIRTIFQEPTVRALLVEVRDLKRKSFDSEKDKETWLERAGFYARAVVAINQLHAHTPQYEAMGNHASHLYVIAAAAARHPEIATHAGVQDLCRRFEASARQGEAPTDLVAERREVLDLLHQEGIEPASIGFDPKSWIKFKTTNDHGQFSFSLSDKE